MTRFIYLLILTLPFGKTAAAADPIDNAVEQLKTGNIRELSKSFASTIEMTVLADENIYSAAQAEVVLSNFFKNNPVKAVTVLHRVNSNPNFRYAVLSLTTSSGVYRTSVSLKLVNGQFLLNEIRIEADKK